MILLIIIYEIPAMMNSLFRKSSGSAKFLQSMYVLNKFS